MAQNGKSEPKEGELGIPVEREPNVEGLGLQ